MFEKTRELTRTARAMHERDALLVLLDDIAEMVAGGDTELALAAIKEVKAWRSQLV